MVVLREVEIIVSPVDNVTPSLDAISRFLDRLSGSEIAINIGQGAFDAIGNLQSSLATLDSTPITVPVDVNVQGDAFKEIDAGAQRSTGFVDKLSNAGSKIGDALQKAGSTGMGALGSIEGLAKGGVSAFSAMGDAVNDVSKNMGNMVTSMAGIAAGGAIAGFSWLEAAKENLYAAEVYKSVDANKKMGVSSDMLKEKAGSMNAEAPGWTTEGKATTELYDTMAMGSKYVGKGQKGLDNSEAISKYFFANQEMLQKGGIGDTSAMVANAIRTPGKMSERFAATFQESTGLSDQEMLTAKSRMQAFMDRGKAINIKTELDERPWIAVQNNVAKLQRSIGDSLGGPLSTVSGIVAGIAGALAAIPIAAGLIGWLAILIATTSAFSLLGSVLSPFISLLGLVKTAMFGNAAASAAMTAASGASAAATTAEAIAQTEEALATRIASQVGISDTVVTAQNAIAKKARMAADLASARATAMGAAATDVDTGATVGNAGASNLSMAARLRLAAANIYHAIASKLSTAATLMGTAISWGAVAASTALAGIYGLLTGGLTLNTVATSGYSAVLGAMAVMEGVATGGAWALAAGVWAALAPLLPFIAAGALIAGVLGLVAAKAGLLGPLLKGLGAINLGKVFSDLGKGDLGGAWKDITKGFKLPSLAEMWGNLTSGLPDLGKLIKMPDLSKIKLPDLGKMAFAVTLGGPIGLITAIFTKLTGGVDVLGVVSGMIYEVLKKIRDGFEFFFGWLKGGWKVLSDLSGNILDGLRNLLPQWMGGYTDEEKAAHAKGLKPGDKGFPDSTRQIGPGETGGGWADYVRNLVDMNPDLANNPKKALEEAHKMYPGSGYNYSDKDVQPLANNIEEYANAPDTARPGLYNSLKKQEITPSPTLEAFSKAPAVPEVPATPTTSNPFDTHTDVRGPVEQAAAGLGLPVITGQTNKAGILSTDIGTKGPIEQFASSLGLPSIAALFGGGSTEAAPTETPAPTSTPAETTAPVTPSPTIGDIKDGSKYQNKKTGLVDLGSGVKERISVGSSPSDWVQIAHGGAEASSRGLVSVAPGEPIVPASLNKPGKLNEALGKLQSATTGGSNRAVTVHVDGLKIELNNPVVPDVATAYHLSDVLRRELEPYIESVVLRKIGQYIT